MIALPFLRSASPPLQGERLYLRPPQVSDYRAWATLRAQSREFLAPWEPLWAVDDLERGAFRHRVRHYDEEAAAGTAHPFFLFRNSDSRLLGGITLGNIRRGVGQNGMIGYWIGQPFAGQGYMSEALDLLILYAFTKVRLHRLEAACIPSNERSIRLLEKAGFQREGLLRSYLKINGMWQDHLLFSLIDDDGRRQLK